MVKPATPEPHEQRCPACGVAFRLADRRKRVQCPHCMEIVEITPDKPAARAAAPAGQKELAELKTRLARLDELEARTEALEHRLATLPAATLAAETPAPEPAPRLIWHEPRLSEIAAAADEMPAAQHETLVANLAALGSRRIVIQAAADDASAARRAARFHTIFEQALWTAPPVVVAPDHWCLHPLALIAQRDSAPREMADLFMALAASGFQPVTLIDPALEGGDPILCVGRQCACE